jgi:hypothetical protein
VVEGECAIEAQNAEDGFGEFANGDIFASTNVDEGWVSLCEEGA